MPGCRSRYGTTKTIFVPGRNGLRACRCAFGIRTAMRNLEFVPVGACLWVPLPLPIRFCVKLTRQAVAAAHSCAQPNG